jgi:hypothetical protein
MDLPVLAFCDGWLKIYNSVEDAEVDLEPVDVANGEWEAFDATGHVLDLSVHQRRTAGVSRLLGRSEEVVRVTLATPLRMDRDRLRKLLLDHINAASRVGQAPIAFSPESAASLPLERLVAGVLSSRA